MHDGNEKIVMYLAMCTIYGFKLLADMFLIQLELFSLQVGM